MMIPTHEMDVTEDEAWQLRTLIRYDENFFRTIYLDDRTNDPVWRSEFKAMPGMIIRFMWCGQTPIVTAKVLDAILPEDQEDLDPDEETGDRRPRLQLYLHSYLIHDRVNTGISPHRLTSEYAEMERAFHSEWLAENKRSGGTYESVGLLQALMLKRSPEQLGINPELLTDREHQIVATIVQWLGTNVGLSFLHRVNSAVGNRLANHIKCSESPHLRGFRTKE